jgi:molecular chaperone DnaK
MTITRAKFEQLVSHLIERCRGPVLTALKDAGYQPKDIDEVVLVGGMTRMPRVQQMVKEVFGKEGHKGVNPDEVVAVGAAIQGAQLLLGSKSDVLLLDVTPLSLGIETLGGVFTKLIERNTTIPSTKKNVFSTADDNQTAVTVQVYQGERSMAADNRLLGRFNLEGIEAAPRGMPQIEVTFDIDANGILNVSAKDLKTGKEVQRRIENSSGLSKDEVERMARDAESHADDDKKKRELADARNEADQTIWMVEKTMKEAGDKLSDADKQPILAAIEKVKQAASGEDLNAIQQALNSLQTAAHALAQHVQRGGGEGAGGPVPGGSGPSDGGPSGPKDDVIDAEFEVKK